MATLDRMAPVTIFVRVVLMDHHRHRSVENSRSLKLLSESEMVAVERRASTEYLGDNHNKHEQREAVASGAPAGQKPVPRFEGARLHIPHQRKHLP
jgi:hypothetical protein